MKQGEGGARSLPWQGIGAAALLLGTVRRFAYTHKYVAIGARSGALQPAVLHWHSRWYSRDIPLYARARLAHYDGLRIGVAECRRERLVTVTA